MALDPPRSLSPSRIDTFLNCPLAFRYANIDRLPNPTTLPAAKGTFVHAVLELLFECEPHERTLDKALSLFDAAYEQVRENDDYRLLDPSPQDEAALIKDATKLIKRYFTMEDPTKIHAEGLELKLESELDGIALRGIIDRLDRGPNGVTVLDYKSGRPPSPKQEQKRLNGVHFYAWLVEQVTGERPVEVKLLYLSSGETITAYPTDQSIRFFPKRATAILKAINKACETENFKPHVGPLCNHCAFKPICPAHVDSQQCPSNVAVAQKNGSKKLSGTIHPEIASSGGLSEPVGPGTKTDLA